MTVVTRNSPPFGAGGQAVVYVGETVTVGFRLTDVAGVVQSYTGRTFGLQVYLDGGSNKINVNGALVSHADGDYIECVLTDAETDNLTAGALYGWGFVEYTDDGPMVICGGVIKAAAGATAAQASGSPGTGYSGTTLYTLRTDSNIVTVTYLGTPGAGVLPGGTDGQFLVKDGASDYSTEWVTLGIAHVSGLSASLSTLTSADVSLTARLSAEEDARASADTSLTSRLSTEEVTRAAADTSLTSRLSAEEGARAAGDASLTTRISAEEVTRANADGSLTTRLSAEEAARGAADTSLTTRLSTEEDTRATADTSLTTRLGIEETTRSTAISNATVAQTSLTSRISTEEGARASADASLAARALSSPTIVGEPMLGGGDAIGAPAVAPTPVADAAGVLTGTYQYAYAESDGTGMSPLSPIGSVTVTGKKILVTVPPPRRGTSERILYRTEAGGSVFKQVHSFGGGSRFFKTTVLDNTADVDLGAVHGTTGAHPGPDTTALVRFQMAETVMSLRSHPGATGSGPADLTNLMGDSGYTSGAYCHDVYGEYLGRTYLGSTFASQKTGTNGTHFSAYWTDEADETGLSTVYRLNPRGGVSITPTTLSDPSLGDGHALAHSVVATLPSAPTGNAIAIQEVVTGAGSAAYRQTASSTRLSAGYTGSAPTVAKTVTNASANLGTSVGLEAAATGAAGLSIGAAGRASAGTKRIGVLGDSSGISLDTFSPTWPSGVGGAGGMFTNGANTDDILICLDNVTPVLRVTNGGGFVAEGLNSNTSTAYDFATSGKGNFRILANGNTDIRLGSTNNVPVLFTVNSATVMNLGTAGAVNFAASSAATAHASAQVEITSTTKGFLPPRMTGTQRDAISSPATGLVVYNTTTQKLNVYTGAAWEAVTSS
mgnify:CR=1 FL=1